ncbi:MAG: hypothetical protein RR135_02890 [Oscillospiraceae bacterium]
MEDFSALITQFLGSEEGMSQLRSVASALGLSDTADANPGTAAAPASAGTGDVGAMPDLSTLLGGIQDNVGGIDMSTILLLQRALSAYNQTDRNTELLRALKPHFSAGRAKKVDDALRILQLIRLLPLLRESGLLGSKGGIT